MDQIGHADLRLTSPVSKPLLNPFELQLRNFPQVFSIQWSEDDVLINPQNSTSERMHKKTPMLEFHPSTRFFNQVQASDSGTLGGTPLPWLHALLQSPRSAQLTHRLPSADAKDNTSMRSLSKLIDPLHLFICILSIKCACLEHPQRNPSCFKETFNVP